MPTVELVRDLPGADPDALFGRLIRLEDYSTLADSVNAVEVVRTPELTTSAWDVAFRGGSLRWTEADTFDHESRSYSFTQLEGDLATFEGHWSIVPQEGGSRLSFHAQFDLGMPTLAAMLDPVAERALKDSIDAIITGLATAQHVL